MAHELDTVINRYGTDCLKWDYMEKWLGVPEGEALPSWVSDWDFKAPDFITEPLKARIEHGIFGYSERGDEYFNSVIDWWADNHQVTLKKEWFHTTPGSLPAIAMLMERWSQPGDKVLVLSPVYHAFYRTITNTQRTVAESKLINDNGYYSINFDDLEQQFKDGVKIMMFCNPHNPGGRVWTEEEVTRVCQLCHQYGVYLISDEIWADIVFRGHKFFSCLRVDPQYFDKLAVCIAGTKSFGLPSMRLTNTMIPNEKEAEALKSKLLAYGIDVYSAFSILANQAAYRHGREWLNDTLDYLEANNQRLAEFVGNELTQVTYRLQESTYLAWLDCRAMGLDDAELEQRLHKAGVIPTMGYGFGDDGRGFIRLNLGCPASILEEKIQRLRTVLK
ncbi:MalY/PatB family protein [Photobacterium aphoticum]|uniref:cysteine-S-conjugate beta-lyase n=1 Tax=Photobacterium aphoticum TaxID=754436 RepID=A0A090QTG5_9GAMM|nr:MalY/PatB family protein [Photobacterium aphoticum]KLV00016.1 PLP-dependent enzyme with beta-cystathionase and maltose regulon repressor activity [Photobacterium aphoticum]PSU58558.1 pyridoxal phosphate-dependent aminotransferase [Photobacterium aphoticum]GAL05528.1 aspartate aminotransferase [Photobacterium aphoticum]GHA48157.1 cystathionine beta-lyase [Photobacterium aphoticum]